MSGFLTLERMWGTWQEVMVFRWVTMRLDDSVCVPGWECFLEGERSSNYFRIVITVQYSYNYYFSIV